MSMSLAVYDFLTVYYMSLNRDLYSCDCFFIQDNKEMNDCLAKIKDELSRTKADNRKLERELLETIQKKIKLSQQVEQWQVGAGATRWAHLSYLGTVCDKNSQPS